MPAKFDLKKELKQLYSPSREPHAVEVPPLNYLMIDGEGAPDGDEFKDAIVAIYPVAYKTKFHVKKELGRDYAVMPLEGLWWADDMEDFKSGNKKRWKWTLMILQPAFVSAKIIQKIQHQIEKEKDLPSLKKIRFETLKEGRSVQMLHIGPFSEEGPNIQKMHGLIKSLGGHFEGKKQKHHEIYLSDPRRVAPTKLKTVLRQPYLK